ncbi:MAG: hypothetical protein HFE90_00515 [Firmicutes bacterium]|nr:hypothetical protein [Bacillota bacterium]
MGNIDYKSIYNKNREDWKEMTNNPQKYEGLLAGHYSDSNHFIYELLQNAEDARASKVVIQYFEDKLIFYHNGKPFDEDDVTGVSSMLMGTKEASDAQTIGKFGMGFKSVFKYTDRPEIYSDDESFCIENYLLPVEINGWDFEKEKSQLQCRIKNNNIRLFADDKHLTKFVIPFIKIKKDKSRDKISGINVLEKLYELSGEVLLFLNMIRNLYWINMETGEYAWITIEADNSDKNLIVCRIESTNKESISRYLKFKKVFDHDDMKSAEVSIAYRIDDHNYNIKAADNDNIFVYFPTKDITNLPFIIHGSFETAVSREKLIYPSDFNKDLFDMLGDLICESLIELRDRKLITQKFIRNILMKALKTENINGTISGLNKKVKELFLKEAILPDINGEYKRAEQLCIPVPFDMTSLFYKPLFQSSFGGVDNFVELDNPQGEGFKEYFGWLKNIIELKVYDIGKWGFNLADTEFKSDTLEEEEISQIKELYGFLSKYSEIYKYNHDNLNEYKKIIKSQFDYAWEQLRRARIILNSENKLVPAYINGKPNIYLNDSSEYKKMEASVIINPDILKIEEFKRMMISAFEIHQFDNLQYARKEIGDIANKYINGVDHIKFGDSEEYQQEYANDIKKITELMKVKSNDKNIENEIVNLLKDISIIKIKSECRNVFKRPDNVYMDKAIKGAEDSGTDLKIYFDGIEGLNIYPFDIEWFIKKAIFPSTLHKLGMVSSLVETGRRFQEGTGDKHWKALGDYCPEIKVRNIEDNIKYIRKYPNTPLSKDKSSEILKLMLKLSRYLKGEKQYRKKNPYPKEEESALWHEIRKDAWLYDKNENLCRISDISKYDLNEEIYELSEDKKAYEILGFKKIAEDENEEIINRIDGMNERYKKIIYKQLGKDLGLSNDTEASYVRNNDEISKPELFSSDTLISEEFPIKEVKNIERLREHVKQQFFFADPVKYEKVLRQIRTSKPREEGRQYVAEMYTNDSDICICQMCKKPKHYIEAREIAQYGIELPQLHLCLCRDCAAEYEGLKRSGKETFKKEMKYKLKNIDINANSRECEVEINHNISLTFTPTHLAEVQTIFDLLDEFGVPSKSNYK